MTDEQAHRANLVATILAGLVARQGPPDPDWATREHEPVHMDRMIAAAEKWVDRIEERARTQCPG